MRFEFDKPSFDRRTILISLASAPIVALGSSRTEAGMKVTQSAVHYQAAPRDGQECVQCAQFVAPHACRLVDGDIASTGWCRLWVKRAS